MKRLKLQIYYLSNIAQVKTWFSNIFVSWNYNIEVTLDDFKNK